MNFEREIPYFSVTFLVLAAEAHYDGSVVSRGNRLEPPDRWLVLGLQSYLAAREITQASLAETIGGDGANLSRVLEEEPEGRPDPRFKYVWRVCATVGADVVQVLRTGRRMAEMYDALGGRPKKIPNRLGETDLALFLDSLSDQQMHRIREFLARGRGVDSEDLRGNPDPDQ